MKSLTVTVANKDFARNFTCVFLTDFRFLFARRLCGIFRKFHVTWACIDGVLTTPHGGLYQPYRGLPWFILNA